MPTGKPLNFTADPAAAYPELVNLRSALYAHDWPAVRTLVDSQEADARTRLISFGGATTAVRLFLQSRTEAEPTDTLAAGMLAACLVKEAWQVRSNARAQYVSREQFAEFHQLLRDAERLLIDAAAYEPADTAVWVQRLITARGLQLGQSEARRRYDRLAEHDPHHLAGQSQLLQQLCPKWGGSFEAMDSFARAEMLAAPEGAPNAVLVAEAHLEHLIDMTGDERRRYLTGHRVHEEIGEAAARSVLHPAFRRTIGWVAVHNTFALMFSLIGDYAAASQQFAAVGNLVSDLPWRYFGDPVTVFQEHRTRAIKRGGAW